MLRPVENKKNILLVDDDRSITEMLTMLLQTRGYIVHVAHSGEDAIKRANQDLDLILLDLVLPDEEGIEICRQLKQKKHTKNIPIIILSGKLVSNDIVEGLYIGADDCLSKPFEYEELVARMEAVMRRCSIFRKGNITSQGEQSVVRELRKIIEEEQIQSVFQPIYMLKDKKLFGIEALSRPVTESLLINPEILFRAAIQYGFYQELELLSWKIAVKEANSKLKGNKLFLNCNPYLVEGNKFQEIQDIFKNTNIFPCNVVLEITERSAITEFSTFYKYLSRYRELGFQFAVDDVGGGYASLESIVQTKPEVVKIDRHIVTDIHKDHFKRSIIKFIVAFCKENGILSIAEGIETKEELVAVKELGVDAGQGYLLYKPNAELDIEAMQEAVSSLP